MKIPLTTESHQGDTPRAQKMRKLAADIAAARRNDWTARDRVVHHFTPLIRSMAERRTSDSAQLEKLVTAGQSGLVTAIHRFDASKGAERFQLFALEFIEKRMNRPAAGGFFSRLLRRS